MRCESTNLAPAARLASWYDMSILLDLAVAAIYPPKPDAVPLDQRHKYQ